MVVKWFKVCLDHKFDKITSVHGWIIIISELY